MLLLAATHLAVSLSPSRRPYHGGILLVHPPSAAGHKQAPCATCSCRSRPRGCYPLFKEGRRPSSQTLTSAHSTIVLNFNSIEFM
ncbi:MAG: hypothetical protein [Cressdnaviricota sp.]|nr:MAG: hypothetical protein [Cressdnaviricota sp.]